ncbi:hypothetical protein M404DRAFT_145372 [Pisolithus tinctorius Marx 270]|uniref:Reverse transcriptase/retrotransposon-derived protein RNase H-like domain-containing protein n=1 Tax=Pisolithus tinctorius Marx 270 TaxID=870435 RepID=A0A0C3NRU4_PISTI|nr:hypothetical protein M404DRAFT_145372 [Pisolithus tinctorius Marx 270]
MTDFKLAGRWEQKHTKVFLDLKLILYSYLDFSYNAPQHNRTPFVVTMDGCQEGFGAVLTQ